MRFYNCDGSFVEDTEDTEFGWCFSDITIDEAVPDFEEKNTALKSSSFRRKIEEERIVILPDVETQRTTETIECKGRFSIGNLSWELPSKENLINLINPCNAEARMLLSIISYSRFMTLMKKDASDGIFKSINFKTTKSTQFVGSSTENAIENVPNFRLIEQKPDWDVEDDICRDLRHYHANKEEKMLSLMVELIITDMDSNIDEMPDLNLSVNEFCCNGSVVDGSEERNDCLDQERRVSKGDFLLVPNKSVILNGIGLSDDIFKSLQSFAEQKCEMRAQLDEIRQSFLMEEKRVDRLIQEAIILEKSLRETSFLSNVIHLLDGNVDRVKMKKWPFRIFHHVDETTEEPNLIV